MTMTMTAGRPNSELTHIVTGPRDILVVCGLLKENRPVSLYLTDRVDCPDCLKAAEETSLALREPVYLRMADDVDRLGEWTDEVFALLDNGVVTPADDRYGAVCHAAKDLRRAHTAALNALYGLEESEV